MYNLNLILVSIILYCMVAFYFTTKQGKLSFYYLIPQLLLPLLLLVLNIKAFSILNWTIRYPDEFIKYFYTELGSLPAWFNLSTWFISTTMYLVSVLFAFALLSRKDTVRVWFLRFLPFILIFSINESLKGAYKHNGYSSFDWRYTGVIITIVTFLIPYMLMFLFYRNSKVADVIFKKDLQQEK